MPSRPVQQCEGPCDHYACNLRSKGLQVSPRAQMTSTQNWRPTPCEPPSINRKIMYEDRPGGTKMPILNRHGNQMRHKEYQERSSVIEETQRRNRNTTSTRS